MLRIRNLIRMISELREILHTVHALAGKNFSGIGIIISDAADRLPLFPIGPIERPALKSDLAHLLAEISVPSSEYHDGFHIVSSRWEPTRIAQYFSPPIVETVKIDRSKRFGGRYLAALFGSALIEVDATGIASSDFGIAIFKNGVELFRETMP